MRMGLFFLDGHLGLTQLHGKDALKGTLYNPTLQSSISSRCPGALLWGISVWLLKASVEGEGALWKSSQTEIKSQLLGLFQS